jgi:hypothetical protein
VEGSSNGCPSAPPSILANHLFVYGDSDPINHIDPTGYSSIGSAIRSVQLRMARVGLERIAKASVHHIGCVVAIATGLFIAQQLVESGVPFIRAPHGGGINLAAGVEGARTGAPVVDGPLRQVVGIYSASPLPRGVRTALDAMEHASQGLLKIVYSQGPHAERAVEAEITSSGREVASMWTLWEALRGGSAELRGSIRLRGGQLARGLGHCIIPSGMAP